MGLVCLGEGVKGLVCLDEGVKGLLSLETNVHDDMLFLCATLSAKNVGYVILDFVLHYLDSRFFFWA